MTTEEGKRESISASTDPDVMFSSLTVSQNKFVKNWKIFRSNRKGVFGLFVICIFLVMSIFAPYIAPEDPFTVITMNPSYSKPSLEHFLGTDEIGRDIFSMLVFGARISMIVGFAAAFVTILIGTVVGLVAGYVGGVVEVVLMRTTDFFLVLPGLAFMLVLSTILIDLKVLSRLGYWGPISILIIVIGITSWPRTARIVRSQVLSVKEKVFVERAKAIGSSNIHIIRSHIFPSVFPLIFAESMLSVSLAIFMESYLSFLGLTGEFISWGMILKNAWKSLAITRGLWWYVFPPGICIILLVLSFSLMGYAFEEILNPKLKKV